MSFSSVRVEGALIPGDILDQVAKGEAAGQRPQDFGLERNRRLTDEISTAWQDAVTHWRALNRSLGRLSDEDPATTQTREQWVLPLLQSLGYDKVAFMAKAAEVAGQSFAISHRAGERDDSPPIHIVGFRADLNARPPSGRPRLSPHALVQEYLNRTEHLWGIVTNGRQLRLLRDSSRMSRPSYVEFDLEQMMNAELFSDFCLLYRLLHRTRLPKTQADAAKCLLETYHQQGIEQGSRVREKLRDGVEAVLKLVGQGLLDHPANSRLVEELRSGRLTPEEYYRQLLRMVYRLLFLMVTEERGLIIVNDPQRLYERFYSVTRLRELCARPYAVTWRHDDLWQGLLATFALFADESTGAKLGMSPLNGSLFGPQAMPALADSRLANGVMLEALRHLSFFHDQKVSRRVNYAALDVEELGSVYESLLDYRPIVRDADSRLQFELAFGTERKTTGSYYTRPELVAELIKSALEPVIEAKLASVSSVAAARHSERSEESPLREAKARALLSIKVCDPACGSGHFLLAAARRIGRELAKLRSGEDEPTPEQFRLAVREVIQHCIYGVDLNPLAVDLCKLALWIEGHSTGKPLSFLDHRIRCGNSLVGVFSLDVLKEGIPDDAYKPVTGDDKKVASAIRKRNRQERETGQMELGFSGPVDPAADLPLFANAAATLDAITDDTPAEVKRKADTYDRARQDVIWWRDKTACDIWTAAFFVPLNDANNPAVPTTDRLWSYLERPKAADGRLLGMAGGLAVASRFFHWPLEFPEVFAQGGFDCVLGNPPFVNVIEGRLDERMKGFIRVTRGSVQGAADLAYYFVDLGLSLVLKANGWVGLVQPRGFLNAPGALELRAGLSRHNRSPRMVYVPPQSNLFSGAAVFVCLVAIGPSGVARVTMSEALDSAEWRVVQVADANWWAVVQGSCSGLTATPSATGDRIGDLYEVTASMTAADAYEVKPFVRDDLEGPGLKLVTTGLIDPGKCMWSAVLCRYLGVDYAAPRIDPEAPLPPSLQRRLIRARRPKVMVAGLSKRIECFLDEAGEYVGAVSTYTVLHPQDDVAALKVLADFLLSESATAQFRIELGGNAMGGGNITMKKRFLQDLRLPTCHE